MAHDGHDGGFDEELRAEQRYAADLYERLDGERARVKDRYAAALRGPVDMQNGGTLVERDAEVRALAREMKRLDVADNGLCVERGDAALLAAVNGPRDGREGRPDAHPDRHRGGAQRVGRGRMGRRRRAPLH